MATVIEHGGHLRPQRRERVADEIDARIEAMQQPPLEPVRNRPAAKTGREQLLAHHEPTLSGGHARDLRVATTLDLHEIPNRGAGFGFG
jgi:hypothetical protein